MSDQLFSVSDQHVLITGGSRGIGRAIAEGFATRGAEVVICSRSQESIAAAVQEMQKAGMSVTGLTCDVSDPEQIKSTVAAAIEQLTHIDTLINVAGVNRRQRAETFTAADYDFVLDTNLRGAFLMSLEVGRHMIERQSGTQINIESLNTWMPLKGVLPYAMSKFGMQGMTRGLALEWGRHGIRVNSLALGLFSRISQKNYGPILRCRHGTKPMRSRTTRPARGYDRHGCLFGLKSVGIHDRPDTLRGWRFLIRLELANSTSVIVTRF